MTKELDNIIDDIGKELPFKETSEIGQVFENLDRDEPNENRMSHIDFNARLTGIDIRNCMVIDELKALGILPIGDITRQKKRLSVSLDGKGRGEKRDIASASRGADLSGRSGGMLSKLFSPRE